MPFIKGCRNKRELLGILMPECEDITFRNGDQAADRAMIQPAEQKRLAFKRFEIALERHAIDLNQRIIPLPSDREIIQAHRDRRPFSSRYPEFYTVPGRIQKHGFFIPGLIPHRERARTRHADIK